MGLAPVTSTTTLDTDPIGTKSFCDKTICKANEYVKSNVCTACAGVSSKTLSPDSAGDDASGADTVCTASLCAANEYVKSNVCMACAAGTSRAAGDNLNLGDTACAVTYCAASEFVSSNKCIKCGLFAVNVGGAATTVLAMTTNTAGDDSSGADTLCDGTLCAVNQYVKSKACVACAAGTTNDAHDDASGPDTSCSTPALGSVPGAAPGTPGGPAAAPGTPGAVSGSRSDKSVMTSLVVIASLAF